MNVVEVPLTVVRPTVPVGFAGPAPAGAAHIPSPRQNVVELAAVPPFKFVVGKFPPTPPTPEAARFICGMSAPTRARSAGAPVVPFGVANTWFPVRPPHHVNASVPVVVIGDPLKHNGETTEAATLDTPPGGVTQVPSPRQNVVLDAPVPLFKFVTGRLPVTPPLPDEPSNAAGTSAPTIARKPSAPVVPLGVAKKLFAVCAAVNVTASVPVEVIGEPVTVNTLGAVRATLLTVPPPVPGGVAHVPSPRQNVVELAEVPLF